jgi:membrane protein YdbS with pleckstrin-like domain
MRRWAVPLLAIYLIVAGLLPLFKVDFPMASLILSLLAIAAGVLMLLGGAQFRSQRSFGVILLAIWLILVGVLPLLKISFPSEDILLAILEIAAGVLLLLRR